MKRIALYPATALLAAIVLLMGQPAWGWNWNPFARQPDAPAKSAASAKTTDASAAQSQTAAQKLEKSGQASQLKQAARDASQADRAEAKKPSAAKGRQLPSQLASRYRWNAAKQPSVAQRAMHNTVSALTLKPLRDKLSGNPTANRNAWSKNPPVANTSSKKRPGMLGSLFKPKPKQKTGPRTVSEWISQDRPTF